MTIRAFNIKYDTDGDRKIAESLPKELIFTHFETLDEVENELADAISDETGFCVYSCEYKVKRD